MRISNYDRNPSIEVHLNNQCIIGWNRILLSLVEKLPERGTLVFECYHGVDEDTLARALESHLFNADVIASTTAFKCEEDINDLMQPFVTDDRIFGFMTRLKVRDIIDPDKMRMLRNQRAKHKKKLAICYGIGAAYLFPNPDILVYVDMARWEVQKRMRYQSLSNIGINNGDLEIARKYKRAYFVDWRICDQFKKETFKSWNYVIDANDPFSPKMISREVFNKSLDVAMSRPFRLVPFFDPGPWGGQWMRKICNLDDDAPNYAWCFDCVPEENSIIFRMESVFLEFPASDLVFFRPKQLLGEGVYSEFGDEFPIRFDFLDTMGGGNLSLQVHPLKGYIKEHFGLAYTQDESYYLLDAGNDACVYLGFKDGINQEEMIKDLKKAQNSVIPFDTEKYVEKWPARKHDHFLIPAGTVHCSGANSMVLEISTTPYIFTFKLWDWGRMGMDGLPRPINIGHGEKSIIWERTTSWTKKNLINRIDPLDSGDGWRSERTGLHETEFIETIRHWFTKKTMHYTHGNLNVVNLVKGDEAIVESPDDAFEPFIIHYAETFIIPAAVGAYTIKPYGGSIGKECATIKAYVRCKMK